MFKFFQRKKRDENREEGFEKHREAHDFNDQKAEIELVKNYGKAEKLLQNEDKIEHFLQRLEKKLRRVPLAGSTLAEIPILASLVKSFVKRQYTEVPIGLIIAIISALIYFVSPIDVIADIIPFAGFADDAAVIAACWKLVESDVEEYAEWREKQGLDEAGHDEFQGR